MRATKVYSCARAYDVHYEAPSAARVGAASWPPLGAPLTQQANTRSTINQNTTWCASEKRPARAVVAAATPRAHLYANARKGGEICKCAATPPGGAGSPATSNDTHTMARCSKYGCTESICSRLIRALDYFITTRRRATGALRQHPALGASRVKSVASSASCCRRSPAVRSLSGRAILGAAQHTGYPH